MPERGKSVLLSVSLCGYARRGSHRGGGGGSGSIAPPPPGSPRSRGGRGAGVGSGLGARAPGGGCAQARRPRGLRAGPAEPGPGLQLDPRRRQRRRRGLARPRRGDHAPFWLAPLRVPSALAAREAGFGAQPGAGGANHGRPSGRGRRVGEAGRPGRAPGAAPRARGIPGSRAPGPGAECTRVCPSVHPPPPPAPCGGSRLAQLGGRARQMRGAGSRPPAPRASRPRRPRVGGRDRGELPGRAQHLRKLAEKFENDKSNRLSASALPMTLQPRFDSPRCPRTFLSAPTLLSPQDPSLFRQRLPWPPQPCMSSLTPVLSTPTFLVPSLLCLHVRSPRTLTSTFIGEVWLEARGSPFAGLSTVSEHLISAPVSPFLVDLDLVFIP